MAVIDVNPLVMRDVIALFGAPGGPDFRKHLDQIAFTPTSSTSAWTGLGKNTHTDASPSTWTLVLNYVQDWDSDESMSRYLYEHEGETVPVTFQPRAAGGPSFTANVTVVAGAVGGPVNAFATTSVTLGSDRPVLVPAA